MSQRCLRLVALFCCGRANSLCRSANVTTVRILLPSFTLFPYYTYIGGTGNESRYEGFLVEFASKLQEQYCINISLVTGATVSFSTYETAFDVELDVPGGYDALVLSMADDQFIHRIYEDYPRFRTTAPFAYFHHTGLVARQDAGSQFFALFDPFEPALWGALALSLFVAAALVLGIEALQPGFTVHDCDWVTATNRYGRASYHMWSLLLGGEAESIPLTASSRLLRLGIHFIILVIVATYTANLAAFVRPGRASNRLSRSPLRSQRWPTKAVTHSGSSQKSASPFCAV